MATRLAGQAMPAQPLSVGESGTADIVAHADRSEMGEAGAAGVAALADERDYSNGPPTAAPPSRVQAEALRFYIDEISESQIGGWVIRPADPSHRCLVAVKEGDRVVARTVASQFRADLAHAGIGDGFHAFAIPTPRILLDGDEHLIEIVEQDTGAVLTAKPILWRSEHRTFDAMADRMGAAHMLVLGQPSAREADRADRAAWAEAGMRRTAAERPHPPTARASPRGPAITGTRILFDISDLVYYIGHHANLTGIQRVQSSIILAILRSELVPQSNLVFLSFNPKLRKWMSIPTGFLSGLLEDLFLPETQRPVSFPAEQAQYGVLPGAREFAGAGVLDDGNPSVLCLLGAAWVQQEYIERVLFLKRHFGTRFVMTVHDLIPVFARETCDQDTARVFEEFMRRALRHTDHILSVSENTAKDLRRYLQALKIPEPAITVTRNGSSFGEFLPQDGAAGDLGSSDVPERFVLFVATIEGRKNHQLMFDIWRRMIEAGDDPPHLVCVGRLGWKSTSFISALVETDNLDGRILLLRDISDTDLQMLYRNCLFTVCPTFYEGWGLPVGESLAMGKICVSSDRASLPEVAGDFGVYIDINDFDQSLATIRDMIADRAKRMRLEAKIRRGYKSVTWRSVAERVVEACHAAPQTAWQDPYPYAAIPYASEVSFGRLNGDVDGTGELLLTRIASARNGVFLNAPLDDRSFIRGEEAHSGGNWDYPEDWGTWTCYSGGEVTLALPHDDSVYYYVILRLRASELIVERPIQISANGDVAWHGSIGLGSRDLGLRVRRRMAGADGWRLRLRAQISLTPELERQIAEIDGRVPTIGFERLIVVPENDLKTRLDIVYRLLL
jgi:glycosyltransferase involved in cell wall biosynthesis